MIELKARQLKRFFDPSQTEAQTYSGVVGQTRAESALRFGLGLREPGYNIYVSGPPGTGKATFAKLFAETVAKTLPPPPDLCYVYNFEDPKHPRLLQLPAGTAVEFREELEDFLAQLLLELPRALGSREFEQEKLGLVRIYKEKCDKLIKNIQAEAKEQNFGVKMTQNGIYFMPLSDGEMLSEEQFDALPEDEKEIITQNSDIIQDRAQIVMSAIKEEENRTKKEVEDLEFRTALLLIGRLVGSMLNKYQDNKELLHYLGQIKEDVLENLSDILGADSTDEELSSLMPWISKKGEDDVLSKYHVNVLTDNRGVEGGPVVVDFNPTYTNLVGEVEYDSEYGNFITDFMKIRPGILHKANGGFLILEAQDVLTNHHVWETLKRTLKTGEIAIEPLREFMTGVAMAGIKPQNTPLDVKIILVGSGYFREVLNIYDDDFQKLFKVNAVFDYEMDFNQDNVKNLLGFLKGFCKDKGLLPPDPGALSALVEHSTRMAEHQDRLSSHFHKLCELLLEANAKAVAEGSATISGQNVKSAISQRDFLAGMYEEKLSRLIEDDIIMIDTTGEKVAQVNGLAVIDDGDFVFAKPSRITATTYVGKAGIVNIEKEAKLSGSIHDKGIGVLSGYLGQTYAQDFPLSLSCRVCFEQNYNGIDGDSASSTELYAIISGLSHLPLRQDLAVTGSINQRGEIQPIGGATYKIEGFFDLCRKRGLTGTQGVIIPHQNVRELTLKEEVVKAVEEGMFHIYAIKHVDEGLELLTGHPAGAMDDKGKYPPNSINGRVYRRLKEYYKKSIPQ